MVPSSVAGGEASEGLLAAGDEVDAVAISSSKDQDCGTNDESDGTGVTDGGIFLCSGAIPPGASSDVGGGDKAVLVLGSEGSSRAVSREGGGPSDGRPL